MTISLRSETRQKLDQMAIAQGEAPGRAVTAAELAATLCIGTLVVEIGYALMIWHRRTRPLWAAATIGLHAGIAVFMGLLTFGALMIVLNVAALVVPAAVPEGKGVRELPEKVGAKRAGAM